MEIQLQPNLKKEGIFNTVKNYLKETGFTICDSDENRPWGGFYVIDESEAQKFIHNFFNDVQNLKQKPLGKISPKILIVESGKRLSWQYHHRRAEVWKVIGGRVAVMTSENDDQTDIQRKGVGDVIILEQGARHRLIGLDTWGIVAEIWQHTDINNPSNEEDIIRVEDDFGR